MEYRSYRGYQGFSLGTIGFLIVTNIIVFFGTFINPYLVDFFGFQPDSFLQRPWTIVTNLFVHGGFGHIFGNMLTLYFFGRYLLELVGERKFLTIYFVGGILGNIFYMLAATSIFRQLLPSFLGASPSSIVIGASGAVFAVGGALTVLQPNLRVFIFPIPAPIPLWVAVIGGFFIMTQPGVAWQGHLGGLVFGLAAGYFWRGPGGFLRRGGRSVYWRGREIKY